MSPGKGCKVPLYNVSTEATFRGTVEEVTEMDSPGFQGKGLHAKLKTEQGTFDVHLGPVSFAAKEKLTLAKGDQLEIVGSQVKVDGVDAVIARKVTKGDRTTTLRNERGVPLWSGGRGKTY